MARSGLCLIKRHAPPLPDGDLLPPPQQFRALTMQSGVVLHFVMRPMTISLPIFL